VPAARLTAGLGGGIGQRGGEDVSDWRKLGLIAGDGDLPVRLAEHCRAAGIPLHVSRITGMTDPRLATWPGREHGIASIGERIKSLKADGVDALVFAGNVRRPDFQALKPDARGVMALPRIMSEARKGDDALLRAVLDEFARDGFRILGVEDVLEDLLAPAGPLGTLPVPDNVRDDLRKAADIADQIGRMDIGQGVVVARGLVLAVEAQDGTDRMLAHVAELPAALRGAPGARAGLLLKRPKPGQERRIDLPTIGLATVEGAARAGLAGIAVEAGAALVMDRAAAVRAADEAGLFIVGFVPGDLEP
jgi:UDP-2,3-diacylglucosamine hydrolase